METCIFKTENIVKAYRGVNALDGVSISIERGKIYGLVGQNGAGKTTLMRLITGAAFATAGKMYVTDWEKGLVLAGEKEFKNFRKRLGSIIELPALNPTLSAIDNMKVQGMVCGNESVEFLKGLLSKVGLEDTGKKKAKDFSLGMKQRLGIAMALVNSPEILILDEPINGLDPIGIVEIRELLKDLCEKDNITMIISSHILSELYQLATNFIFINKGKIIMNLSAEQLDEKLSKKGINLEEYYIKLLKNVSGK